MIARICIYLILVITLPDWYLDRRFLRKRTRYLWWQRVLWWLPGAFLFVYTIILSTSRNFAPESITVLNIYLLLFGIIAIPKFIFALCSFLGWAHCRYHHTRNNWGNVVGPALSLLFIIITIYGGTFGFNKFEIRHETFYSKDLPAAFDGYKIVQFSDAHVGTYAGGHARLLEEIIDSINSQDADMVAFTGDLQNMEPKELYDLMPILGRITAKDGIFSVLGNHDYSGYIKASSATKVANERELISIERQLGWDLLMNGHDVIRRGGDSIVIAGMENDGGKRFPQKGDVRKTLAGVKDNAFVIMLEHDPTSWRKKILPQSEVQLTLSGHTHAGQIDIFGLSPAAVNYDEWYGMYAEGDRALNVTSGMGALVPFRLGASNEIVVITLRTKR